MFQNYMTTRVSQEKFVMYFIRTLTACTSSDEVSAEEKRLIQQLSKDDFDEEYLLQKISMLQLRLDEAQKTLQAEREYALDTL